MRGVATHCIKQYRECQISAINDGGESIKNRENFLKFEAKFEKLSDTEKGLGGNPLVKKSEAKILLDCPCDVHGTILLRLVQFIL